MKDEIARSRSRRVRLRNQSLDGKTVVELCEWFRANWRQLCYEELEKLSDELLVPSDHCLLKLKPGMSLAQTLASEFPTFSATVRNQWCEEKCEKTVDGIITVVKMVDRVHPGMQARWLGLLRPIWERIRKENTQLRTDLTNQANQLRAMAKIIREVWDEPLMVWVEPIGIYLPIQFHDKYVHNHRIEALQIRYGKNMLNLSLIAESLEPLVLKCGKSFQGSLTWGNNILSFEQIQNAFWMWTHASDHKQTILPLLTPVLQWITPLATIVCTFLFLPETSTQPFLPYFSSLE